MSMTKQLNLFADDCGEVHVKRTKKQVFEDYDAFCSKFSSSAPKTTDDCYTPQPVYDAVLEWLRSQVNIEGRSIVRPFYPGGDYKNEEYPENCVVVDNPPFSILAEIVRFYTAAEIDFFLFAPGLMLFSSYSSYSYNTAIVANANIVYANGASVQTGFLSSLFPDIAIMVSTSLHDAIEHAQERPCAPPRLRRYEYPNNVVSSALLNAAVGGGILLFVANSVNIYELWTLNDHTVRQSSGMAIFCARRRQRLFRRQRQRQRQRQLIYGNYHHAN